MSGFSDVFSVDNKFFSAMNKVADLFILNALFLLTVLLGIGPACTALYYATVKNLRKSRGYAWKEFFKSFRLNFKQGFICGILQAVLVYLLYVCYVLSVQMNPDLIFTQVYYTVVVIVIITALFVTMFVYPVLSRFTLTFWQWMKMSFMMAMRHLPTTFILTVLFLLVVLAVNVMPLFLFVLPGLHALISSFLIERVFKKYMPKQEEGEEAPRDAWYLE